MQTDVVNPQFSPAYRSCGQPGECQHINTHDPAEIIRWSNELGITWLQLFRIIDRVGTSVRTVRSAVLNDLGVTWH